MFCLKCGTQIHDDATFCMKCGATQTAEAPVAASAKGGSSTAALIELVFGILLVVGAFILDAVNVFGWHGQETPTTAVMAMKIGGGAVVLIVGIVLVVLGIKGLKKAKKQS